MNESEEQTMFISLCQMPMKDEGEMNSQGPILS